MQTATPIRFKPFLERVGFRFLMVVLVGSFAAGFLAPKTSMPSSVAQETKSPSTPIEDLRSAYEGAVDELRVTLKQLKRTEALYLFSDSEASHEHKEKWEELATKSESQFSEIREKAYSLFWAMEKPDDDLMLVVRNMNTGSITQGRLGLSHRICKRLVELNPDNKELAEELIRIEIFNNKFDDAAEFKTRHAKKIKDYNHKEKMLFRYIDDLKKNFDRELKLREKDKTANLPRVEMKIKDKGTVILELFEDEAPETVANFISLVEVGFYDGIIFHHAINSYLVHGGYMSMTKPKPTGYTIYDEFDKPERRHHFRGSISMWSRTGQPDTCGSEFSILRMPGPYLPKSTVFGRVIQGMEIIDRIQNTRTLDEEDGSETPILDIVPDTIESMKVIRKRDHPYEPNPVK